MSWLAACASASFFLPSASQAFLPALSAGGAGKSLRPSMIALAGGRIASKNSFFTEPSLSASCMTRWAFHSLERAVLSALPSTLPEPQSFWRASKAVSAFNRRR
ncbi:hypothetical protein D3C72_1728820 [compost metagenome]